MDMKVEQDQTPIMTAHPLPGLMEQSIIRASADKLEVIIVPAFPAAALAVTAAVLRSALTAATAAMAEEITTTVMDLAKAVMAVMAQTARLAKMVQLMEAAAAVAMVAAEAVPAANPITAPAKTHTGRMVIQVMAASVEKAEKALTAVS